MPDDNIKAVLKRAAEDSTFFVALMTDREAALKDVTLEPHERQMLLSVSNDQLGRMIEKTRLPMLRTSIAAAGCITAAAVGLLFIGVTNSRGARPDVAEEMVAQSLLQEIAVVQERYRADFGQYGSLADLKQRHLEWPRSPLLERYVFDITVSGDTFTTTARHRERPDTRKAFTVGPDGVVKELPRAEEKE